MTIGSKFLENVPGQKTEAFRYTSLKKIPWALFQKEAPRNLRPQVDTNVIQNIAQSPAQSPEFRLLSRHDLAECKEADQIWKRAKQIQSHNPEYRIASPRSKAGEDFYDQLMNEAWEWLLWIRIPKNVKPSKPFYLTHDFAQGELHRMSLRIVMDLEEGSAFTFYEMGSSDKVQGQRLGVLQRLVNLEKGASLHWIHSFAGDAEAHCLQESAVHIKEKGAFTFHLCDGGRFYGQHQLNVTLAEKNAHAQIQGFFRGQGEGHSDFQPIVTHRGRDTQSNVDYYSVLLDQSKSVFNGKIRVTEEGIGSVATQSNRNILMSQGAQAITLPKLEIETDDVQCKHGATVSSISEEQLFYLQSRGIHTDEAVKMITAGFMEPVLKSIHHADIENSIRKNLNLNSAPLAESDPFLGEVEPC